MCVCLSVSYQSSMVYWHSVSQGCVNASLAVGRLSGSTSNSHLTKSTNALSGQSFILFFRVVFLATRMWIFNSSSLAYDCFFFFLATSELLCDWLSSPSLSPSLASW